MTAMNSTALFQHYVQNIFKLPKDIKHDIVYCQRALKAHIKVHQMVLDVYKTQLNPDPVQKKRIIDELETQIYEINAEQQFLLLRLRRAIDDFYKTLTRKGAPIIPEFMNEVISSELVPLINDQNILIYPMSVRLRLSEEKLIEKYFEVKTENPTNCYEVLDSDEEEQHKIAASKSISSIPMPVSNNKSNNNCSMLNAPSYFDNQVSLLKPMSQRLIKKESSMTIGGCNDAFIDASQFVEVMDESTKSNRRGLKTALSHTNGSTVKNKIVSNAIYPVSIQESKFNNDREDLTVSKKVKMSRLNLRQALKKARTETLVAKAVANILPSESHSSSKKAVLPRSKSATELLVATNINKKFVQRTRAARALGPPNVPMKTSAIKTIEVNSSSGDSTPERSATPHQTTSSIPSERVDTRIKPEDFGQEMFLRMFGLFTPEMRLQMQQRRSKRKRRTVQSNERSDFHYGRIEYGSFPPPEEKKKRKAFLQSPQTKSTKQSSADKSDGSISRSSSSSPDDKRGCNECLKSIPYTFERCEECKGYYHPSCHREQDESITSNVKSALGVNTINLCPACKRFQKRIKSKTKQYNETLQTTAKELEQKMALEKSRHKNLQKENETFKTQMNKIYNIVNAIKSDPDNSSD